MGNWNPNNPLGFIPTGLYDAMAQIQREYSTPEMPLSLKEVEITLLRAILEEKFGFKCDHDEERIITNKQDKTYCKWCYRRFEVIEAREIKKEFAKTIVKPGKYRLKKTFLDKEKKLEDKSKVRFTT